MLVRYGRRKEQVTGGVPENGVLPYSCRGVGIGRVDPGSSSGSPTRYFLQGIEDIEQAGKFNDAADEREKDQGQQGELHGGYATLPLEGCPSPIAQEVSCRHSARCNLR